MYSCYSSYPPGIRSLKMASLHFLVSFSQCSVSNFLFLKSSSHLKQWKTALQFSKIVVHFMCHWEVSCYNPLVSDWNLAEQAHWPLQLLLLKECLCLMFMVLSLSLSWSLQVKLLVVVNINTPTLQRHKSYCCSLGSFGENFNDSANWSSKCFELSHRMSK